MAPWSTAESRGGRHPGRNQSRAYISNHNQCIPTTRPIVLPDDWEDRLAR